MCGSMCVCVCVCRCVCLSVCASVCACVDVPVLFVWKPSARMSVSSRVSLSHAGWKTYSLNERGVWRRGEMWLSDSARPSEGEERGREEEENEEARIEGAFAYAHRYAYSGAYQEENTDV